MKKNITSTLATALLLAVLGALFSCSKEKPKDKVSQLAGTQWVGTITKDNSSYPYNILFFSTSEGEATIPTYGLNPRLDDVTVSFHYSMDSHSIKFDAIPDGSDPWYRSTLETSLHGTWLLKEHSKEKLSFYRTPGYEVVVTLKRIM